MTEPKNQPGPGRATADAAFMELKKQVAARNEEAHRADREKRAPRERELVERRRRDALR
jgi:hypothetical protein